MKLNFQGAAAGLLAAMLVCLAVPIHAAKYKIRWTVERISADYFGEEALYFKNAVEKRSGGDIQVDVVSIPQTVEGRGDSDRTLFPDELGDSMAAQAARGETGLGHSHADTLGQLDRRYLIFSAPYLFRGYRHAEGLFEGPLGAEILEGYRAGQVAPLLMHYRGGARGIATTDREIRRPEDLKGLRIGTSGDEVSEAWLKSLGARPVAVGYEEDILQLARDGLLDGVVINWGDFARKALDRGFKFMNLMGSSYKVGVPYMKREFYDGLPDKYRSLIVQAAREAGHIQRASAIADNENFRREMLAKGVRLVHVSEEERRRFLKALQPVYHQVLDGSLGKALLKRIRDTADGPAASALFGTDYDMALAALGPSHSRLWSGLAAAQRRVESAVLPVHERAEALGGLAQLRFSLGDYSGAEESFRRALELRPGDSELSFGLAEVIRERPREALRFAEEAARAPSGPRRRSAALRLAGEIRRDLGDAAAAKAHFRSALELAGNDYDVLTELVVINRGRPQEAAAYAKRAAGAAAKAPRWYRAAALRQVARLWLEVKDYPKAIESLKLALEAEPDDLKALDSLIAIKRERPGEAVILGPRQAAAEASEPNSADEASLMRALEAEPDDLESLRLAVESKLARRRTAEAAAYADRFMAAVPRAPVCQQAAAYRLLARRWAELGDFEKTLISLQSAWNLDKRSVETLRIAAELPERASPFNPETRAFILANLYSAAAEARFELKDEAGAEESLRRALKIDPGSYWALQMLAHLKAAQGRLDEARRHNALYLQASAKAPPMQRLSAHSQSAEIRLALQDEAGAQLSLERALEAVPDDFPALRMMTQLKLRQGRAVEARHYEALMVTAAEKAPAVRRPARYRDIADVRLALKDEVGAEEILGRALDLAGEDVLTLQRLAQLAARRGRGAKASRYSALAIKAAGKAPAFQRAALYRWSAELRRELKDMAGAESDLERALAIAPDDAPSLRLMAELQLARGESARARESADLLIKVSENEPASQRLSAYRLGAETRLGLKDEVGAEEVLKRALDIDRRDAAALQMMVELRRAQNRPAEALDYSIRLVEAAEAADPARRLSAYRQDAEIRLALKDEGEAEKSLKRALDLDPEDFAALRLMAQLKLTQGDPARTREYDALLLKAADKVPPARRAFAYRQSAEIRLALKDAGGARESLESALEADPNDAATLQMTAQLHLSQGRPQQARRYSDRLIKAAGKAPPARRADIYRQSAEIRLALKDEAGARKDIERALESRPDDFEALWLLVAHEPRGSRRAEALVSRGRPAPARLQAPWLVLRGLARALSGSPAAREDFTAAVKLDAASVCLGDIFRKNRNRLAEAYFDACVEEFPEDSSLHLDRGIARYQTGRAQDALADFQKAVALRPDNLEAHMSLITVLASQARAGEALAATDRAIDLAKDKQSQIFGQITALRRSLLEPKAGGRPR